MKRSKKRRSGDGSVYRRKNQERWVTCITDPTTGKRIQTYARSEQEASQKLKEARYKIKQRRFFASVRGSFRREQKQ